MIHVSVSFKAGLQPTDDITVVYEIETLKDNAKAAYLQPIVQKYSEYISEATKQPLKPMDCQINLPEIIHEKMEVQYIISVV